MTTINDLFSFSLLEIKEKLKENPIMVEDTITFEIIAVALHTEIEEEMFIYREKQYPQFLFAKTVEQALKDFSLKTSFTDQILFSCHQENGIYTHYKNKDYLATDVVYNVHTNNSLTLYQALYDDFRWFVRPFEMFHGHTLADDIIVKRFTHKEKRGE